MHLSQKCNTQNENIIGQSLCSPDNHRTQSTRNSPSFGALPAENNQTVYFLKGCDERTLSNKQQQEVAQFVKSDPFGSSFYVYNSHEALRKLNQWKQNLPWIQPFYAIKSNPIAPLVKDLTSNGAGVDVASAGEIQYALSLGIPASSMIYSNSVKEEKDILYAAQEGVQYTTADTFEELEKISQLAPNMKILWRISIPEDNSKQLSTIFSNKFGDNFISEEDTIAKFEYIRNELQIKLHGIHFHCGSGKDGSSSFYKAIQIARQCIKIGRDLDHPMEILDLGGGCPSGELNEAFINALKETREDPLGYKVIAEPGRYFSSHSCYLMTRILAKRIKQGKVCYHINESVYHSFNCILMDSVSFENDTNQFYSYVNGDYNHKEEYLNGSLFGMTCDGRDVIAQNFPMPSSLKIGDWLCFGGMGSYTYGCKSEFNGMKSTTHVCEWSSPIGVPDEKEEPSRSSSERSSSPLSQESSPIWIPTVFENLAF